MWSHILLLFLLVSSIVTKWACVNYLNPLGRECQDFRAVLKQLCNKLCNCSVRNMYIYIHRNVKPEFLIFILNKLKCSFKSYRYNKTFTNLSEVKTFKVFCTHLQCNGRPTTKIVICPEISVRLLMGCTKYTHINNYTGCKVTERSIL